MRRRLDDLEFRHDGLADAVDFFQAMQGRRDDTVEIPEGFQQQPRQRLDVPPRNSPEQHKLHQLIIRQGLGAADQEPFAQARSVVPDIGRQLLRARTGPGKCLVMIEEGSLGIGEMRASGHVRHPGPLR